MAEVNAEQLRAGSPVLVFCPFGFVDFVLAADIRFKPGDGGKARYIHTLNGSGLATSRLMVALLENNQTEEGTVMVPRALVPYTGFSIIDDN